MSFEWINLLKRNQAGNEQLQKKKLKKLKYIVECRIKICAQRPLRVNQSIFVIEPIASSDGRIGNEHKKKSAKVFVDQQQCGNRQYIPLHWKTRGRVQPSINLRKMRVENKT